MIIIIGLFIFKFIYRMASSGSIPSSSVGPIKPTSNFFPMARYRSGVNSAAHAFFARPPPNATANIGVNALTRNFEQVSIGAKALRAEDLVPPPSATGLKNPFGAKQAANIGLMMSNNHSTPSQRFASSAARQATALKKGGKRRSTRRRRSNASKKRRSK
jgi:hypothetical protein